MERLNGLQSERLKQLTPDEHLLVDREHRYLSLLHLFLDGQCDASSFYRTVRGRWAEDRQAVWHAAQVPSRRDLRPLARLIDGIDQIDSLRSARRKGDDPDNPRLLVQSLLTAYREAKAGDPRSVLSTSPRPSLFERPLPEGWAYPCTLEDIRQQIGLVPEQDLHGLWAVGLAPPEREDRGCYGTYFYAHWRKPTPVIFLHARPASLSFRTNRSYSIGQAERRFAVELSYGMRVEGVGSRVLCHWEPECLRRFVAEHVLRHEIGHHVQRTERLRQGLSPFPGHTACEQFAEDYALRMKRQARGRVRSVR